MNHPQIPATTLPREILFKSDNEEIEAFVCRDAQDEEAKTLSETTGGTKAFLLSGDVDNSTTSNHDEIVKYTTIDSPYGKFSSASNHFEMKNVTDSPKGAKRSSLDLSPDNFFMTSNEINGKWRRMIFFLMYD